MVGLAFMATVLLVWLLVKLSRRGITHIAAPPPEPDSADLFPFPSDRTIIFGLGNHAGIMAFDREIAASAEDIDYGNYPSRWRPVASYRILSQAKLEYVDWTGRPHWILNAPKAAGLSAWDVYCGKAGDYVEVVHRFQEG